MGFRGSRRGELVSESGTSLLLDLNREWVGAGSAGMGPVLCAREPGLDPLYCTMVSCATHSYDTPRRAEGPGYVEDGVSCTQIDCYYMQGSFCSAD